MAGVWNLMSFPVGWRSVSSGIAWLCAKRGSYWFLWHVINFPIYSRAPIKYEAVNFNIWRESGKGAGINSRMILMQEAWYFILSSDKWFRLFCVYQIQTSENNLDYRCVNDLSFHNHIFIWIHICIYICRLNFWGKTYCSYIKKWYICIYSIYDIVNDIENVKDSIFNFLYFEHELPVYPISIQFKIMDTFE